MVISKEYISTGISKVLIIIFNFLNSIMVSRYLGVAVKGEFSYILNISSTLILCLSLGIGLSYNYFCRQGEEKIKEKIVTIIIYQTGIYFICYLIGILIFRNEMFVYIGLLTVIGVFSLQISYIVMIEEIIVRNKIAFISIFTYNLIFFILIYNSKISLNMAIITYAIKGMIEIVLYLKFLKCRIFSDFSALRTVLVGIVKYSSATMIITVLITMNYSVDVIIMKAFVGFEEIGIYTLGVTICNMIWVIPDIFKDVLMSKTAKGDHIKEILFGIKINCFIAIITVIVFLLLGKEFIKFFYGENYSNAFGVTAILIIGVIPMIFYKLIHPLYLAKGKQIFVIKILMTSVVLNVFLNISWIEKWGIKGAAWSSVFSYLVCGGYFLYYFLKEYKEIRRSEDE